MAARRVLVLSCAAGRHKSFHLAKERTEQLAKSIFSSSGDSAPKSTPDWTKPYGVTTPRIDTLGPQSPSDFPSAGQGSETPLPFEVEDRGTRSESDGGPTIWKSYEEGY